MLSKLSLYKSLLGMTAYAEEMPMFDDTTYNIQTDAYTIVYDETYQPLNATTPGTALYFSVDSNASVSDEVYFACAFLVDGTQTVAEGEAYTMPDHSITVSAIFAPREDYLLDISDGSVRSLPNEVHLLLSDLPVCTSDETDPSIFWLDFNEDGTADAKTIEIEPAVAGDDPTYTIQLLPAAVGQFETNYTVSFEEDRYKTITFLLVPPTTETYYTVVAKAAEGGTADGGALLVKGATARVTATPKEGYAFDGWYAGQTKVSDQAQYTFTVSRDITLTARFYLTAYKITAPNVTTTYNISKKIVVTVTDINGKPLSGKAVTIKIGSTSYARKTNADGIATVSTPATLAVKTYTVSATCEGKTASFKLQIKKASPKINASAKTYTAANKNKKYSVTLKTNKNKPLPKQKVIIKVNKRTYTAKTNKKGVATFKLTSLKKKGSYKATIKFASNKNYNSATKKVTIKVK